MAIKFRTQEVKSRPLGTDGKPDKTKPEIVVGEVEVVDMDHPPTLAELCEGLKVTEADVVRNFVRQHTQDEANKLRADYIAGWAKRAKQEAMDRLLERVKAGDLTAVAELKALL